MPKPLKPGSEQTERRVTWVVEKLERTPRDSHVVRAAALEFKVTDRQAREYVRLAYDRIREARKDAAPFDFERMEAIKFQVIENALADRERAIGGYEEAPEHMDKVKYLAVAVRAGQVVNAAADQLTRMRGLYQDKVEHTGELEVLPLGMSADEVEKAVLAEAAAIRARKKAS